MHKEQLEHRNTDLQVDAQYSESILSLLILNFSYRPNSALRTQLQGSTHSTADTIRPLCTQLQSLNLPLQPITL